MRQGKCLLVGCGREQSGERLALLRRVDAVDLAQAVERRHERRRRRLAQPSEQRRVRVGHRAAAADDELQARQRHAALAERGARRADRVMSVGRDVPTGLATWRVATWGRTGASARRAPGSVRRLVITFLFITSLISLRSDPRPSASRHAGARATTRWHLCRAATRGCGAGGGQV